MPACVRVQLMYMFPQARSSSLNLSYVYFFFSRGPSEFPITARIRRLASPTYRPRGEGLSVCGCNCGSTGHGRGRHGPATSTCDLHSRSVGRPHQAAPACAPQQQVQPNRSTAQPQFRHRPTTQGQLRHCGPPWLHGGTIPAPNRCARPAQGRCARASARQRLPPTQPQVCSGRNAMCWCPALARRGRHRPAQPWHAYMNQYQQ